MFGRSESLPSPSLVLTHMSHLPGLTYEGIDNTESVAHGSHHPQAFDLDQVRAPVVFTLL